MSQTSGQDTTWPQKLTGTLWHTGVRAAEMYQVTHACSRL